MLDDLKMLSKLCIIQFDPFMEVAKKTMVLGESNMSTEA